MKHGGCKVAQIVYENGQEWHPMLPTGEQKCVTCRCKVCTRTYVYFKYFLIDTFFIIDIFSMELFLYKKRFKSIITIMAS